MLMCVFMNYYSLTKCIFVLTERQNLSTTVTFKHHLLSSLAGLNISWLILANQRILSKEPVRNGYKIMNYVDKNTFSLRKN